MLLSSSVRFSLDVLSHLLCRVHCLAQEPQHVPCSWGLDQSTLVRHSCQHKNRHCLLPVPSHDHPNRPSLYLFHSNLVSLEYRWSDTGDHTSVSHSTLSTFTRNLPPDKSVYVCCNYCHGSCWQFLSFSRWPTLLPAPCRQLCCSAGCKLNSLGPPFHSTPDTPTFSASHFLICCDFL